MITSSELSFRKSYLYKHTQFTQIKIETPHSPWARYEPPPPPWGFLKTVIFGKIVI